MSETTWTYNGVTLPTPTEWSSDMVPIESSYSGQRALDGTLHTSRIRMSEVIDCRFGLLTGSQKEALDEAFSVNSGVLIHPLGAGRQTKEAIYTAEPAGSEVLVAVGANVYWRDYGVTFTQSHESSPNSQKYVIAENLSESEYEALESPDFDTYYFVYPDDAEQNKTTTATSSAPMEIISEGTISQNGGTET